MRFTARTRMTCAFGEAAPLHAVSLCQPAGARDGAPEDARKADRAGVRRKYPSFISVLRGTEQASIISGTATYGPVGCECEIRNTPELNVQTFRLSDLAVRVHTPQK